MPGWSDIVRELQSAQAWIEEKRAAGEPVSVGPFDIVRRGYLSRLHAHTGRATILYATQWTEPGANPSLTQIDRGDVTGLMECMKDLPGPDLDIILHSPGGRVDAAEALVNYIRSKFDHVRVFIPQAAMSAATMLACSADRIVMGKHSSLGPTDPQFVLSIDGQVRASPAKAILSQFERAKTEIAQDGSALMAWMPMLKAYGPSLLEECRLASELAEELVKTWLRTHMFGGTRYAARNARKIARKLTALEDHGSHARCIDRETARVWGLVVDDLETDQTLQDLVLSVFHAAGHTMDGTPTVKMIENHQGRGYFKLSRPAKA